MTAENFGAIFDMEQANRFSMYEEMGKHIARLLYKHDCVVVPNFGAFLTHYQSASVDAVSGAVVPPTKTLSFNTALNHNDGLLATAIAQQDHIAYSDAIETIQIFVRYWNRDLSLQGILSLQKVGRFISDAQGRTQFLPDTSNYNDDAYLLPTLYFAPLQAVTLAIDQDVTTLERNRTDSRPAAPIRPLPRLRQKVEKWENAIVAAALLVTGVVLLYLISPAQKINKTAQKNNKTKVEKTSNASIMPEMPTLIAPSTPVAVTPAFIEPPKTEVKAAVLPEKTIKIAKITNTKPVLPQSGTIEKSVPVVENTPVERLTVVLGAYKSPANVEALMLRAKANNDLLTTAKNAKGLTVVSLTVQIKRSEIGKKVAELERIYGTKAIIK
jgi:CCDC81-like prokaryotic HU domain 1/CCDC81-like prokaryotic HU domain 2